MEKLIVKLMAAAALAQLGLNVGSMSHYHSRQWLNMFEMRSRDVLKIDWKPISVFPDEVKRFK